MALPVPARRVPVVGSLRAAEAWREVAIFLGLAFGFAWALWGYWVVAMPPDGLVISPAFIACAIIGGLAPTFAAIAIVGVRGGIAGVAKLLATARRPVAPRCALLALVMIPTATVLSCTVQALSGFRLNWPDPPLLAMAFVWPIMAALGEEFGWRGFLAERLTAIWGLLPSTLAIGLVWGGRHLPADYVGLKGHGNWFWLAFLINGPIVLTGHSIVISWLWTRTERSTLVAVLYHWSVTFAAITAPTPRDDISSGLLASAINAGAVCLLAAAVLVTSHKLERVRR